MTSQYQEESINGQPAPLSLLVNPTAAPVAGLVDTEAVFWPSLPADAAIIGSGISVVGSAAVGSIIEISAPGLYEVEWTLSELVGTGVPVNIVRGATVPIIAGNGYPAADYAVGLPLGAIAIGFTQAPPLAAPINAQISTQFRILDTDLEDPVGGVNPGRQIRFAAPALVIPTLVEFSTLISVARVSK